MKSIFTPENKYFNERRETWRGLIKNIHIEKNNCSVARPSGPFWNIIRNVSSYKCVHVCASTSIWSPLLLHLIHIINVKWETINMNSSISRLSQGIFLSLSRRVADVSYISNGHRLLCIRAIDLNESQSWFQALNESTLHHPSNGSQVNWFWAASYQLCRVGSIEFGVARRWRCGSEAFVIVLEWFAA